MANSTNLLRALAVGSAAVCLATAFGCGNNPAQVVKPDKATNTPAFQSTAAASPDPSKPAKYTKAQVDQIKLGMSAEQVKNILGLATFETSSGQRLTMQWVVPEGQSVHIDFENGKVLQKTAAGLGPIKEKLTQANLDKISTGMTEANVFEILGPGSSESELSNGKSIVWEGNGKNVLVQIEKGKVVNKMVFQTN